MQSPRRVLKKNGLEVKFFAVGHPTVPYFFATWGDINIYKKITRQVNSKCFLGLERVRYAKKEWSLLAENGCFICLNRIRIRNVR